ncbi:hypothetical protein [Lysobacter brunescens]|uniref:Uncharacterized protein n=1 Tax=Lysobacter brunescens TaxID=262323 RepID=A0ABW2YD93_9GAMM
MSLHRFPHLLFVVCCVMSAAPCIAADRIQPARMEAEDLVSYMPDGGVIEIRLDQDVTGDGLRDLVFVARNDETRVLKVMVAYADEFDMGYAPVGEMRMGDSPLGDASLSVKKGVLIVEDLDGGTTAIQSLYRFRFDPKENRMRLIGDDVSLYSRTNAHDSTSISTNRLAGVQIVKRSVVGKDGYTDQPEQKKQVSKAPVWMEDAPSPAKTLDWDQ